ncbi:MAG: DUF3592 domain-containing protein [Chitinophagaceae bacterium]|nr:MAG: DUF3592 domain-containing protein [Chitinophagaceae bacterium]
MQSKKATGKVEGIGSASGISLGRDTYALVSFSTGKDTVYFQGKDDDYQQSDIVPLRYQPKNPEDARIATFHSLWGNTIAYIGAPLLFLTIFFFAKDLVPHRSKILIGKKPFFKVIPPAKAAR